MIPFSCGDMGLIVSDTDRFLLRKLMISREPELDRKNSAALFVDNWVVGSEGPSPKTEPWSWEFLHIYIYIIREGLNPAVLTPITYAETMPFRRPVSFRYVTMPSSIIFCSVSL